jgi:lauroyl/myristoyl acyltransferase
LPGISLFFDANKNLKREEAVRKHSDQYLWVHKRWKTRENEDLEKIY